MHPSNKSEVSEAACRLPARQPFHVELHPRSQGIRPLNARRIRPMFFRSREPTWPSPCRKEVHSLLPSANREVMSPRLPSKRDCVARLYEDVCLRQYRILSQNSVYRVQASKRVIRFPLATSAARTVSLRHCRRLK